MCGIYGRFTSDGILKKFAGNRQTAQNMQAGETPTAGAAQVSNGDVILEQIEKLAGLKDKGILSEEEYQQKKPSCWQSCSEGIIQVEIDRRKDSF